MGDPRKTKAIRAALLKKGFIAGDTHHEMFWLIVDGKKSSVRTRISHGAKEYGDELLALVARQVGLSKQELYRLIDCPMEGGRFRALLVERGRVKLQ